MVHSAPRTVLILGLIIGACGVQHQRVQNQGTVAKKVTNETLGEAVRDEVMTGLWYGVGIGGARQLWLGYQHCLTTKIFEEKIKTCNQQVLDCTNKPDERTEELCKADLWNNGASGCAGAWEVERGWKNKPFTRNCVGPYEITKRALSTAIWGSIGTVPGFLVGTIQFFAENLKACQKAFNLEDQSGNNTDFDYNDFITSTWWVQKMLHEEPEGVIGRCRKMSWNLDTSIGQVRERTLNYKAFVTVEIPPVNEGEESSTETVEVDVDKSKYRRCLNYPDPSKNGIMEYGGCWTGGQTTDYFVPYYNKSTGVAIVFQGQPSIMNKEGKCLYAKSKNVGNTFGRGQADGDPKYRRYEKSFWILSKAKNVPDAYMTSLITKIDTEYNVDIRRLQSVDNLGDDC